jgi:lipopolysaccharide transport protein LptA
MKSLLLLAFALFISALPLPAQIGDDSDTPPPPNSTVITSDELRSDQNTHISVFTGKVVVVGTNFHMTCKEMTVYFTTDNKVDHLVAIGDVIITQPDRVTHCGHAEYYRDADTFILTDQPIIREPKNTLQGTKITIDRKTGKLTTEGGKTTVTIQDQNLGTSAGTGTATPSDAK